jgi:hypothetical protein
MAVGLTLPSPRPLICSTSFQEDLGETQAIEEFFLYGVGMLCLHVTLLPLEGEVKGSIL